MGLYSEGIPNNELLVVFSDSSSVKRNVQSNKEGLVTNDEFVKIMMTLQNSSQLVTDPSKALSSLTTSEPRPDPNNRSSNVTNNRTL